MDFVQRKFPKEPITEASMIHACARLWDNSYFEFRNFFYRREHEADLFLVSRARYATEVEVKISLSDWRADLKKPKHKTHKHIKFFYYAVPAELQDKAPEGIDPRYGLIVVDQQDHEEYLRAKVVKEPQPLECEKIPKNMVIRAFTSVYYRAFELHRTISALQRRVAALKGRLPKLPANGDACPSCKTGTIQVQLPTFISKHTPECYCYISEPCATCESMVIKCVSCGWSNDNG